jgi:propanol-preferring alcohol dehydrogenase
MVQPATTYRAVHAVGPGKLELTQKPLTDPPPGHVRIRVEACGVCHSDSATVDGVLPIEWPRVPGHEAVGRIDLLGSGVAGWQLGQRVGVGFLGGNCGYCVPCRDGDLVNCQNQPYTGVQQDGGYAEMMVARATGLIQIPDELNAVAAAPLLCAGLTTFSALRNSGAKAGDLVAILGIGGLGHLAVQYARRMGFRVVAIGLGPEIGELARKLGAHHYIDSLTAKPAEALQALGGAAVVLATASAGRAVADTLKGLGPHGEVVVLGATADPIELSAFDLLFASTLKFSVLTGVEAMIETMPLERAPEAYAKMMAAKARFRMVLTMK